MVKNPPVSVRDSRGVCLIPGLWRSPGVGMATHSSILTWEVPRTEDPGGLQSMELQESDTTERLHAHTCTSSFSLGILPLQRGIILTPDFSCFSVSKFP